MAKLTTVDIANLSGNPLTAQTNINNNNALIETALENTLSRDGTIPNTMGADLDMNSYDINNVGEINSAVVTIGGVDVGGVADAAASSAAAAAISEANAATSAEEAAASGVTDHVALSNIGTNTHAQIDAYIANTVGAHQWVDSSGNIYFDAGSVGIGTTSAIGANLHIYEDSTSVVSQLLIEQDGLGDAVMEFKITGVASWSMGVDNSRSEIFIIASSTILAGGEFGFSQNGTFVLQAPGSVSGWGGSYPTVQLGDTGAIGGQGGAGLGNNISVLNNAYWTGTAWKYVIGSEEASRYTQLNGEHIFYDVGTGSAGGTITWATRLTIDDGSATSGNTSLNVYDVDNDTLERVTVGGADSGGSGYKLLRILN